MSETQESICQWAQDSFGTAKSLFRILTRANEEMTELLVAIELNPDKAPEEAADIAIILCRAAKRLDLEVRFGAGKGSIYFGLTPIRLAVLANSALSDAIKSVVNDRPETARVEIDVCVDWLIDLELHYGTTLQAEIDKKMAINRARTWDLDGSGHGYHCGA
tara:strand:- start:1099 stop:1584 length:486 start_codon:yes stop_codon:yes gene_type:complete